MSELPIDDAQAALYTVGQVADMLGLQQAFLRRLDTLGVVRPARSEGGQRRYTRAQIDRLAALRDLLPEGHTVASAHLVLGLQDQIAQLEAERDAALAMVERLRGREQARPKPGRR